MVRSGFRDSSEYSVVNPGFPTNSVATEPATDYCSWVLRNVMRNIMWPVRELVCGWGDEDACHVHARTIALLASAHFRETVAATN